MRLEEVSWQTWGVYQNAEVHVLSNDAIHLSFSVYAPSLVSTPLILLELKLKHSRAAQDSTLN